MAHVAVAVPVTTSAVAPVRVTRNGTRLKPLIPALALSPGAARPYGVNLAAPGTRGEPNPNYMVVYGEETAVPGVFRTTWAADDGFTAAGNAIRLAAADVVAPAALRVICMINGVPIPNSGTATDPAATARFRITADDGGTLELGLATYGPGTKIELFLADAADVVDLVPAAMTANVPEEIRAYDVMGSVAADYSVMI